LFAAAPLLPFNIALADSWQRFVSELTFAVTVQGQALKELLSDWHNWLPLAGLALLAIIGIVMWFRRKPEDASDIERQRRAYLNRVGRIVEGQVLELTDHELVEGGEPGAKRRASLFKKRPASPNGTQKLLHYTYSISGVTYETAQDITGMEEASHLSRVAAGQVASVKYDPSNPSNSILLADDWSGLH
jgi:LPXTG-motif cell wall-anchored protein